MRSPLYLIGDTASRLKAVVLEPIMLRPRPYSVEKLVWQTMTKSIDDMASNDCDDIQMLILLIV